MNEVFNTITGKNDNCRVFIMRLTKVKIKIPTKSKLIKLRRLNQIKKSMKTIKIKKKLTKMVLSQ